MKTALYWFRNDLRITDNPGLLQACRAPQVLAAYCFDPRELEPGDFGIVRQGPYRTAFLRESVRDLQEALGSKNIALHLFFGRPEDCLPGLVRQYGVDEVHLQREWTRDECAVRDAVRAQLPAGVPLREHYGQFLFLPEDLPYESFEEVPEVFTGFRKKCEKQSRVREPLGPPEKRADCFGGETDSGIPGWEAFGIPAPVRDSRTAFPFRGGASAAWDRLNDYFWENRYLSTYKHTRNGLVGTRYSSKFSPWLANGSISAREIYHQVRNYEREVERNQDTYWLVFELIWRDYFKYVSLKHGPKIFYSGGLQEKEVRWESSQAAFDQWSRGETGNDFINANMLELAQTGWMSNRGRQNVASYWSQNLGQDWRVGAAWFQYLLLDYDVHSNWGNWMYNSTVGNDPRNRSFNPDLQANRYDASGKFRRLWLQPTLFNDGPEP
ncbi:DASH family cryptochrome [Robiginitalea sp. SC105]|uniref:DASH family cryptochrome n=1 Tax=Robiginitalea sp. SC105 TaxID=2762332 RepID=UPI00351BF046